MLQDDQKYSKFVAAITREANENREALEKQTQAYKDQKIKKARQAALEAYNAQIERQSAMIHEDFGRTLSQKELEVRKKLFLKRDEIKTSVFDQARQQLVAFTETADYPSFLTRCMQSILTEFPDTQGAVVFLRTCDLQYSDTISHAVQISCSFTADDTIQLGGLKVRLGDIIADDTLDTRLASQSQWFEEHSGLIIK